MQRNATVMKSFAMPARAQWRHREKAENSADRDRSTPLTGVTP
ncbi:hypothetical protein ACCUM_0717 [Candidatus Accumulibacter phosphatis]|uniref:Uncharacterized protein n=1 Tax=Candidatus Accumulibacter phosphatis TaxID=327160 RepID=A0A5S4ETZ0_9PROT|nr:hypothetical protein ACCUM_0717 [Candidatus Accumulibacter phosphatis]